MSASTKIEWTGATWNPVTGCAKVSQGCKRCYAERDWQRLQHLPRFAGRAFTDVACHPERPDTVDGIAAKTPRQLADLHEDDGTVLWWRMPVEEPPYCGSPLADDWPGCHTHWTPILVPDALPVEVSA